MREIAPVLIIMTAAGILMSGCYDNDEALPIQKGLQAMKEDAKSNTPDKSQAAGRSTSEEQGHAGFKHITNDRIFQQISADGREIWFDKWHLTGEDFTIGGKKHSTGLGIGEFTVDGNIDTRDYAFVKYKILEGKYSSISGIFGFDDSAKVKADSRLIAYANGTKIFESPIISPAVASMKIKFSLPQGVSDIAFRFETNIIDGYIPRVVFADAKAIRAELHPVYPATR
ncbi:MAG: NPCBM/NEW2 domain-containing protein [Actinobacteria bacterium]|nr:NPCBM/NEW2 domain-containing protein [Actinomycetota bacterium]